MAFLETPHPEEAAERPSRRTHGAHPAHFSPRRVTVEELCDAGDRGCRCSGPFHWRNISALGANSAISSPITAGCGGSSLGMTKSPPNLLSPNRVRTRSCLIGLRA